MLKSILSDRSPLSGVYRLIRHAAPASLGCSHGNDQAVPAGSSRKWLVWFSGHVFLFYLVVCKYRFIISIQYRFDLDSIYHLAQGVRFDYEEMYQIFSHIASSFRLRQRYSLFRARRALSLCHDLKTFWLRTDKLQAPPFLSCCMIVAWFMPLYSDQQFISFSFSKECGG